MTKPNLETKIARLESIHDQLESELIYIDELLKSVGFPDGIQSAKEIAKELIETEGVMVKTPKKARKHKPEGK